MICISPQFHLISLDLINQVESFISSGEFFIGGRVDSVIKFTNIEDSAWFMQETENIDEHVSSTEPSQSVREVNEDHMGLIFIVMLFFKVNMVSGVFVD